MLSCQKAQFSIPDGVHYLNCAYMGPLSMRVQEVGMHAVTRKGNPSSINAPDFFSEADDARRLFARLINAPDANQIAIIPAVSYGIAIAAANAPVRSNGTVVVASEQFPSNVYSWRRLAARHGLQLKTVDPPDGPDRAKRWNELLLDAIDSSTCIVALPNVHWTDGTRFALEDISARARDVDAMFIVDGTQSIGAMPFDLSRIPADAVVCAAYKWLLGPYSIGCAYFGERFNNGVPLEENWIARAGSEEFAGLVTYRDDYQPGALRYDFGEKGNFILLPMLIAALEQILEWTPEAIQEYCGALTRDLLKEAPDLGFNVESPGWRGSHLFGLRAPEGRDLDGLHRALRDANVFVSRRGSALRIAPNVYNDGEDIGVFSDVLHRMV